MIYFALIRSDTVLCDSQVIRECEIIKSWLHNKLKNCTESSC